MLTVKRIGTLTGRGALDFGGSEYEAPSVEWIEPEKKSPEDEYGWWTLSEGSYQCELNESVRPDAGRSIAIQTWSDAARAGISHPTVLFTDATDNPRLTVIVGRGGIAIKENARISQAVQL
jgi:hypothetical protein